MQKVGVFQAPIEEAVYSWAPISKSLDGDSEPRELVEKVRRTAL